MLTNIAKKIFGSRNDRLLKQYRKSVAKINALEEQMKALSDADLQAKTAEFKQRLANGQTLDDILVEAFAVCREASRRVLGMRHFDVQLIGGMVLHDGKIAEMRTGEGKTLVATLAVYLNALSGKGVHVVTVNDYLASRDAGIMAPLYNFRERKNMNRSRIYASYRVRSPCRPKMYKQLNNEELIYSNCRARSP